MKVGDLVKFAIESPHWSNPAVGIVVRLFEQKHWDTGKLGKKVNWEQAPFEDFAEVLMNEKLLRFQIDDLEVVSEATP